MKYLITESQNSRLKNQISKSFDEVGFVTTINRYKLSIPQLDRIYQDSRLPEFSCDDLQEICSKILYDNDTIRKISTDKYNISISGDEFLGAVYFSITKKDTKSRIDGYATPFWDGNCHLPVDIDYFNWVDKDGKIHDEEISGEFFDIFPIPKEYESFQEIVDWLNNDYIEILIDFCEPVFEKYDSR
jgi:hypothetical protein